VTSDGLGLVLPERSIDTKPAWRLGEADALSLTGQELLTPQHDKVHDPCAVRRAGRTERVRKNHVAFLTLKKASIRLTLIVLTASLARAAGPAVDEYRVKAAFLLNFARFIEWPATAFKSADEPISVCVLGKNPFGSALEDAVRGKAVGGRSFVVRQVSSAQEANPCHILFVEVSKQSQLRQLFEDLKGFSILTVGDTEDFTANGGVITFKLKDARVRFEIAVGAAERANLRISSKLLSLAETTKR
jgi:hypothetical protein